MKILHRIPDLWNAVNTDVSRGSTFSRLQAHRFRRLPALELVEVSIVAQSRLVAFGTMGEEEE